ncbi:MAG: VWA domain-containing protein [Gammaproteobacteria bacterium]|jgi:Ca-activated chloride channel family protein|nr:VWA domain-containing protein [Gammaproteobacteria bacterium]MBT6042289.1 VWA domain-containing protein [Gammaproteobacteria bacterium]
MPLLSPEMIENFHFLRPLFLYGLIPTLIIVCLLLFIQSNRSTWTRAIDPALLPFLLDKNSSPRSTYPLFGLLLLWTLGLIALAGPVWEQIPVPVQEREDALVIVADMSLSMYANDVAPNRAIRAQRKIVDVLNTRRDEGQTALVVYAGDAHAVTPLTDDVETINNLVSSLEPNIMPVRGSKPEYAIELALTLLENSSLPQAQILLMTDGINADDIGAVRNQLRGTLHTLSVLGIGTDEGAPIPMAEGGFLRDSTNAIVIPRLERSLLQELAAATGGRYADAQLIDQDIEYLLDQSVFDENDNLIEVEREFDIWYEAGPWLLLLVLPLAALSFRRGWLLGLCLAVIFLPEKNALAWELKDLWVKKDVQATEAFEGENYEQAASLFKSEPWRAAANYRTGNFENAIADLSLLEDAESHYNRGNSLARLNRYPEAIAAYDQALALLPDNEDAQFNKELLEKIMEQQEQEQQEQQQNSDGENQDEQQQGEQQESEEQQQSQDQSEQSEQEQEQNQQENQEQQESDEETENESETEESPEPQDGEQPDSEEEQAMQQWLRRIPDDPGELLRRKFQYQAARRRFEEIQNPNLAEQEENEQIW